ncbi:TMAO reductase system periplasmic protein TorT [Leisingera aquaemixtae]|uniref:TMAO reductase system periplasmic protein TorT n=1 Tax=Leisingera aquaemixtae TaxID=1396826 RepID=A0ABY5WHR4_9RHOB|nr:TMAO reductase system periplasmic protein TorT [Leisingera aquaemixtae]UWQ41006.1 TMAO reductase system periplasmic protein TorT [Leisingera aquaemixtae]
MHTVWLFVLAAFCTPAAAETWRLQVPRTPFDYDSGYDGADYRPLDKASHAWRLCVAYPHLKDAYWLSVNYGMVAEADRLGVSFQLVEAGGYPNLQRQIRQAEDCVAAGADALILGTVSFGGLTGAVKRISQTVPVIAAVNDIADAGITAKVGVSWSEMGAVAGRVIAARHPKGTAPVKVAWFPGPEQAGWVKFVEQGFRAALEDSSAVVAVTKYGDTGREIQVRLVEEALDEARDLDYIAGSAPAAEAAVSVLRARGMQGRVQVVSDYMTHAVYRGVIRGRIIAAPTDLPVLQGRLAIEMAVRAIEGKLHIKHAGPKIQIFDQNSLSSGVLEQSLAPASFVPVFDFQPQQ